MFKTKLITNIAKRALVEAVQESFAPSQNEQYFISLLSKRVGLKLRPWGIVANHNTFGCSLVDMSLSVLGSYIALSFKMNQSNALLGNSDANYNIWKAVSQLQEFLTQNNYSFGYVCVITPNASINKINTFAPIVGSARNKTRIVMSRGREPLFITNHTIEWFALNGNYQLCIISIDNRNK